MSATTSSGSGGRLIRRRLTVAVAVGILPFASVQAQSELVGRVVSDAGAPIAGANVTLTSLRYTVRTDSLGRFRLSGTPGSTLSLALTAEGFRDSTTSVVLSRGRPLERDFVLVSAATPRPMVNPSDRVLQGRVVSTDGEPVSYANLHANSGRRLVTDDSGRFTIPAGSGAMKLVVRRIGFSPAELNLPASPDTAIRITMTPLARSLPGQVVRGRAAFVRLDLGGFYRRMEEVQKGARVGYFLTPEDLASMNPVNVTDVVLQFPNIRIRPVDQGPPGPLGNGVASLAHKFRIENTAGCPFTVYLDRVRIQPLRNATKWEDEMINTIVQPQTVSGIEVYHRGNGAPNEFGMAQGSCGVVLIWSK